MEYPRWIRWRSVWNLAGGHGSKKVSVKKYVLAISGGVDSVAMLDMFMSGELGEADSEYIIAHFDHGIRDNSASDADFVRGLAERYGLKFEARREELGRGTSEDRARVRRYAFLNETAKRYEAKIVTAHHADDVIETIAINISRGTGWRGLAVMDNPAIWRPLLGMSKADIKGYAVRKGLSWREDSTNSDTRYLRNDLRQRLANLDQELKRLLLLYHDRQLYLARAITEETRTLAGVSPYSRYDLIMMPPSAALELLREIVIKESGRGLQRPQLERALIAVKTFGAGKRFEVGEGVSFVFTSDRYVVEATNKVIL